MNTLLEPFNFRCEMCFDTRIWLSPLNIVTDCPHIAKANHPAPNQAALILHRAVENLTARQLWIQAKFFDTARILTNYTSANPCPRQLIVDYFFAETQFAEENKIRNFHNLIESLRVYWLLPVGSRKTEPSGYWIITDLEDYKDWVKRATTAPITQLSTIHRNARHNFPVYAEQMELEFWDDMNPSEGAK